MDTIIERDSNTSAVGLFLGILMIVVLGGLALYFLRVYPFNTTQRTDMQIDATLPDTAPVEPDPSTQ